MSVNRCFFYGRLGDNPDVKTFDNGKVANFTMAINESRVDANGQRKEYTEWVKFSAFGKLADLVAQYLHKGDKVFCEGSLRARKYTRKDGVETVVSYIQLTSFDRSVTAINKPEEEPEDDFSDVPM